MSVGTDPRIGTELSGYRIDELVGQGGMGVVYKAWDKALERPIGLKLIKPGLAEDERFRERFLRESRVAASIDHSHIVPIHDAGEWEGELYIAMRYVEGTDLKELLREERPLDPARALAILAQAASALDAAHEQNLVHRDVKPANILITSEAGREEHVYLSDFGLSKPASSQEEGIASVQLSGSSDYAAPEQIEGKTVNRETDVYSLGCVLYECLAGEVPFRSSSPVGVLFSHLSSPPPSLSEQQPEIEGEVDSVVTKALAKDPEERYGSCTALIEDAKTALLPEPSLLDRIGKKGIAALALVGAAILAAAIVPAVLLTGSDEARGTTVITQPSLQKIDPETNELVETVELNAIPDDIVAGVGAVWLLDRRGRALTGMGTESSEVTHVVDLGEVGQIPDQLTAGDGVVLLLFAEGGPGILEEGGSVWAYRPSERQLTELISSPRFTSLDAITRGFGDIWVWVNDGGVRRFTEASGDLTAEIDLIAEDGSRGVFQPHVVATDEASVWLASGFARPGESYLGGRFMVWRVDPVRNELVANVELAGDNYDLAAGGRSAWVSIGSQNQVVRIDSKTNQVVRRVTVGRRPSAIAVGEGAVWVANSRDGTVSRIDGDTLDVKTIEVGGIPAHVAAGEGTVWVTVKPR